MRRPHLTIGAVVVGMSLAMGAGAWALVESHTPDDVPAPSAPTPPTAGTDVLPPRNAPSPSATDLTTAQDRDDPVAFARATSEALFAWDTAATEPAEVRGRLLAVADPSGAESPGLISDLEGYIPSDDAWDHLRQYGTRQRLEISTAAVPRGWEAARTSAPSGVIAPGTTAVTVTGIRHRDGVWAGTPVSSRHDVAFTVFVICDPTYPTCYVLRLSALDNPLR